MIGAEHIKVVYRCPNQERFRGSEAKKEDVQVARKEGDEVVVYADLKCDCGETHRVCIGEG